MYMTLCLCQSLINFFFSIFLLLYVNDLIVAANLHMKDLGIVKNIRKIKIQIYKNVQEL